MHDTTAWVMTSVHVQSSVCAHKSRWQRINMSDFFSMIRNFSPSGEGAQYCNDYGCVSVCLYVYSLTYLKNKTRRVSFFSSDFTYLRVACGPLLAALRYITYFRFCGWRSTMGDCTFAIARPRLGTVRLTWSICLYRLPLSYTFSFFIQCFTDIILQTAFLWHLYSAIEVTYYLRHLNN